MNIASPAERPKIIKFTYQEIDDNGNRTGFFSRKGSFDGTTLTLHKSEIPVLAVMRSESVRQVVVLYVATEDGGVIPLRLYLFSNAGKLVKALNQTVSQQWADGRQQYLNSLGMSREFKSETCPFCGATVDLSGHQHTPQYYCYYCESIVTRDQTGKSKEKEFNLCEGCGFYSRPQPFSTFYFVFLVVVYYWRHGTKYCCHVCMRKEAWKMFWLNMVFVLGFPFAVIQLFRVYFSKGPKEYKDLNTANQLAARGKPGPAAKAIQLYEKMAASLPHRTGIDYNIGLALFRAGLNDRAVLNLADCLKSCANYSPAYNGLRHCYEALGWTKQIEVLEKSYNQLDSRLEEIEKRKQSAAPPAAAEANSTAGAPA